MLSACGAALLAALPSFVGSATALRAVVALLGFAYVLYTIGRSGERVGRLTTVACWVVVASGAWLIGLPFAGYVLVHIGLVWLVRSLYFYSGLLPALADLGLSLLGAAFAVWAAQRSDSAWLVLWCFFLVQSFHVLIPASLTRGATARDAGRRIHASAPRGRGRRAAPVLVDSLINPHGASNMKTNILVTGVVLATVGTVLLYPTIRGNAAVTPTTQRHRACDRARRGDSASRSCSCSTRRAAWAG